MFVLWSYVFNLLSKYWTVILGILGVWLFKRNKDLKQQNRNLTEDNLSKNKMIEIQEKVIDVTQNTKNTDFDGNIKRMRSDKL